MRICLFKFNFFAVSTVDAVFTVCSVDTVNTVLAVFTVFSVDAVCAVDTVFAVFAVSAFKSGQIIKVEPKGFALIPPLQVICICSEFRRLSVCARRSRNIGQRNKILPLAARKPPLQMRFCLFEFNFFSVNTVDTVFSVRTVHTVFTVGTVSAVNAVCAVLTRLTRKFRNGDKVVPFALPCAPLNMRVGFPELGIIIKFTDFYKFVPLAFGRIFPHNGVTAYFNFNIIGAFSAPRNKHKRKHRNSAKRG